MALFYAILATLIISGIAVVLVALSTSELRLTARSASWEGAIHAAEGGADVVITRVNDDSLFTTSGPAGDHVFDPADSTPEAIEAWAVDVATTNCVLVPTGDGEACGIRPRTTGGAALDVVFGVGFVPSLDNPQATRVVRVEYDRGFLATTKAILTGGNLTISGSAEILGLAGNVHTNADLVISGSGATVSGDVTYSGNVVSDTTGSATPAPSEHIDDVSARAIYDQQSSSFAGSWYDLCPNGLVREPSADGPCQGTEIWNAQTQQFRGWSYRVQSGKVTWRTSGGAPSDGIYYVYRGNAALAGAGNDPSVTMTVLLESESDDCTNTIQQGHFDLGANLSWQPFLADAMIIADGDIAVNGTPSQSFEGAMMAREQIKVTGNPTMEGSLIAEDRCDTPGSPVSATNISGNMRLTHNGNLLVPVDGIVRIIAWNEL